MKKTMKAVQLTVLLAVGSLLLPGAAQAQEGEILMAEIPFEFVVGKNTLPAGTYKIEVAPGTGEPPVLAIQTAYESEDELRFRKIFTSTVRAEDAPPEAGKPRLVFKKVGEVNFLEKVVPPSGDAREVR